MDMLKRQADALINSKRNDDFQIYFHPQRQSDRIRKEMEGDVYRL